MPAGDGDAKDQRQYIHQLLDMGITLSDGSLVPLTMVATLESKLSFGFIHRKNGKRVVEVKAALDKKNLSATSVFDLFQEAVIPKIEKAYPDVTITAGGELEQEGEVRGGLVKALILIILVIYALLLIPVLMNIAYDIQKLFCRTVKEVSDIACS